MNKIVEALKKNGVFFFATTDGDKAQVRPFGAIEEIDGKVYTLTNNKKEVYKQLMSHPKVQLSSMGADGTWLRVDAVAVRRDDLELRKRFLDLEPELKGMYSADDGIVEVIELTEAKGVIYSFTAAPVEL